VVSSHRVRLGARRAAVGLSAPERFLLPRSEKSAKLWLVDSDGSRLTPRGALGDARRSRCARKAPPRPDDPNPLHTCARSRPARERQMCARSRAPVRRAPSVCAPSRWAGMDERQTCARPEGPTTGGKCVRTTTGGRGTRTTSVCGGQEVDERTAADVCGVSRAGR